MSLIENPNFRWWFTLYWGWNKRKELKRFLTEPNYQIQSVFEITAKRLDDAGIAILVLDFDGVLANHGADKPLPDVEVWLRQLCYEIGELRIAILTNKPLPVRIDYFTKQFPLIHVVQSVRKKPYPDGILEVANYKGVPPHRVVLVDDRLLTGMLASCLAYSRGWYFRHPYQNLRRRPIKELFFSTLRVLERCIFRLA